ncbi:MAG: RNA-directed DNA polymerase [Acidobacteria bacterium]|nr:RNA-directed DNA polymerase [Acidobacteriota bacterium]
MSTLERLLGVDQNYLYTLASRAGAYYFPFPKRTKPRPFQKKTKPFKRRIIDNPSEELKVVQLRINDRLLRPLSFPPYMFGGVKRKRVLDNVHIHLKAKVLVKIDLASFFPSITNRHVYQVWQDLLGCSPEISSLLTRLTTFERHLPQGAPTSTLLANLVLHLIDGPIRSECERLGIRYSTWVDDLAFSSENPRPIINFVISALRRESLRISRRKLEIIGPGKRKILNGVVISRSLSVPPDRLARIRSGIHKLRSGQVPLSEVPHYSRSLRGSIAQVSTINPATAEKLYADMAKALSLNN